MTTEAQLRHIEIHQTEFDETYGDGETRDVREYFLHEYAHVPDLYENVCSDLEIEPLRSSKLQGFLDALTCVFPTMVNTWDDEGNDVVCAKERDGSWTVSPGRPR